MLFNGIYYGIPRPLHLRLKPHMGKPLQLACLLLALLFWTCKPDSKYSYAIKDFSKELQSHLTQMVAKEVVTDARHSLQDTTDKELEQLGNSEHPILRAAAFRAMLYRESFDHFKIMMNPIVSIDAGEWGTWFRTVSDDIIEITLRKSIADKNKTVEAVITKHNYLRSAYTFLDTLAPNEIILPLHKRNGQQEGILMDRQY